MSRARRCRAPGRDRGSTTIELAILAPAVITFFVVAIIAGRFAIALQAADSAAFDAARNASLSRTEATALTRARTTATNSFTAQGIRCQSLTVNVDTSGFRRPVGQPASVRVEVVCVAELRDVALPGMPGSATLRASFISPLDTYRSRR
jgi:Flp pilus assembly protein TadG